jgi:hypothetical protein
VIDSVYFKQAELLLWIIPLIDREAVFSLKGGTAINFFARDIPRISVDAAMRKAFVVYLISHHRPMIEVLNPGFLYIRSVFKTEFQGMTLEAVRCEDLEKTRNNRRRFRTLPVGWTGRKGSAAETARPDKFTKSTEESNAENLLILKSNKSLWTEYIQNVEAHKGH